MFPREAAINARHAGQFISRGRSRVRVHSLAFYRSFGDRPVENELSGGLWGGGGEKNYRNFLAALGAPKKPQVSRVLAEARITYRVAPYQRLVDATVNGEGVRTLAGTRGPRV